MEQFGLPLEGYSSNLIFEDFSKTCCENSRVVKNLTKITSTLLEDRFTFVIISLSLLLRIRNISDKCCGEI